MCPCRVAGATILARDGSKSKGQGGVPLENISSEGFSEAMPVLRAATY
jgi:hypothetical protein